MNTTTKNPSAEFTHNGTLIQLTTRGEFVATDDNGMQLITATLSAMKSKLDKARTEKFVPFDAFELNGRRIKRFKVTGIVRSGRRRYGSTHYFKTDIEGEYSPFRRDVKLDTPANRQAALRLEAYKEKRRKLDMEMSNEQRRLNNLVKTINAMEMAKPKVSVPKSPVSK